MSDIAEIVHSSTNRPLFAIDPGTEQSGWVMMFDGIVSRCGVDDNDWISCNFLREWDGHVAIEMIASYGMAVGREVFETCVWIGRFIEAARRAEEVRLIYRRDVKLHLCGSAKAKDANIRVALLDLYGGKEAAVGRKANPGPLYGVKSHAWAALGVAVTAAHQMGEAA